MLRVVQFFYYKLIMFALFVIVLTKQIFLLFFNFLDFTPCFEKKESILENYIFYEFIDKSFSYFL